MQTAVKVSRETCCQLIVVGSLWTHSALMRGRTRRVQTALGFTMRYAYDAFGHRTSTTNALGFQSQVTYDERSLYPVAQTDNRGHTSEVGYDILGRQTQVTDPSGAVKQWAYDIKGRLVEEVDALLSRRRIEYTPTDQILREIDPMGAVTAYTYSQAQDIVIGPLRLTKRDALGEVTGYAYDARGSRIQTIDPRGYPQKMGYDSLKRLMTEEDALGNINRTAYDAKSNILVKTDPDGYTTTFAYDAADQKTRETDALGYETTYVYDANGRVLSRLDALGFVHAHVYDEMGRLTQMVEAANGNAPRITRYVYDGLGQLVEQTDPNGLVTKHGYDENGNRLITTRIDEDKRVLSMQSWAYDARNLLTKETDANGYETFFDYDAVGRRTEIRDEIGIVQSTEYDKNGRVVRISDGLGQTSERVYNLRGDLIAEIDALNQKQTYEVDPNGNRVSSMDRKGTLTRFHYDAANRLTEMTAAADTGIAATTRYQYDARGHRIEVVGPESETTQVVYDGNRRRVQETDPLDRVTVNTYDALGRMIAVLDADENMTRYEYNAFGERTTVIDALGYRTETGYDMVGRPVFEVDALGVRTQNEYDTLGRMTKRTLAANVSAEAATEHFVYDAKGQLIARTDAVGARTRFVYDARGRRIEIVREGSAHTETRVQKSDYDVANRLVRQVDPNGHPTNPTYDKQDRLLTQTDALGQETRFEYDENGNRTKQIDALGRVMNWHYDARSRLIGVVTYGRPESFHYDLSGRRLEEIDANGVVMVHGYDLAGQRTSTTFAAGTKDEVLTQFAYDVLGRQTAVTNGRGHRVEFMFDALGRLTKEIDAEDAENGIARTTNYDGAGNVVGQTLRDGTHMTRIFDARRNLRTVAVDGQLEQSFAFDGADRLLEAIDHNGGAKTSEKDMATFVYGADVDRPLSVDRNRERNYFLSDAHHNIRGLSSNTGEILEVYAYSPFGERQIFGPRGHARESSAFTNTRGYTGRPHDQVNTLVDFRARVLSPAIGRFLTRDPLGFVDGFNRYTYVKNNPLRWIDPSGLRSREPLVLSEFATNQLKNGCQCHAAQPGPIRSDVVDLLGVFRPTGADITRLTAGLSLAPETGGLSFGIALGATVLSKTPKVGRVATKIYRRFSTPNVHGVSSSGITENGTRFGAGFGDSKLWRFNFGRRNTSDFRPDLELVRPQFVRTGNSVLIHQPNPLFAFHGFPRDALTSILRNGVVPGEVSGRGGRHSRVFWGVTSPWVKGLNVRVSVRKLLFHGGKVEGFTGIFDPVITTPRISPKLFDGFFDARVIQGEWRLRRATIHKNSLVLLDENFE